MAKVKTPVFRQVVSLLMVFAICVGLLPTFVLNASAAAFREYETDFSGGWAIDPYAEGESVFAPDVNKDFYTSGAYSLVGGATGPTSISFDTGASHYVVKVASAGDGVRYKNVGQIVTYDDEGGVTAICTSPR